MMIEKSGSIELRDISIEELAPEVREMVPEIKEMAAGMVRVKHLYRSALKIAVTQMEILDEEFAGLYDHSPIHHIEHRIKTLESAAKKLKRRGYDDSDFMHYYSQWYQSEKPQLLCSEMNALVERTLADLREKSLAVSEGIDE